MRKRILWLFIALVLIFAVGCAAESPPAPEEAEESQPVTDPTAEPPVPYPVTEATAANQGSEAYPVIEATPANQAPAAYPVVEETETAEAAQETLNTKPTKTPVPAATATPFPEEVLQLQPVSPKNNSPTLSRINFARKDLAGRLGIDLPSTEIKIVAYEEVLWSDSSLGCPEPDMMYSQVMVDGYVIQMQVGDQKFNYHGENDGDPFLCTKTSGLAPEPQPGDEAAESMQDPHAQRSINLAKVDLANNLGVEFSAVELVSYEEITWNDGSLGCPQPDMMYTQALIDGYKIQLQVDGQVYNYHGATGEDPFLCTN